MSEELEEQLAEAEKRRREVEERRFPSLKTERYPQQKDRQLVLNDLKDLLEQLLVQDKELLSEQARIKSYQHSEEIVERLARSIEESQKVIEDDFTAIVGVLRDAVAKLHEVSQQMSNVAALKTANLELERKALNKLMEEL